MTHRRGTGVPQFRQVADPMGTGWPHFGQILRPTSTLSLVGRVNAIVGVRASSGSRGYSGGGVSVGRNVVGGGSAILADCPRCFSDQHAMASRSVAASSSVGDSGCPGGLDDVSEVVGTGTITPQSGHFPCGGGEAPSTFRRRPHGQKKRMYPSSDWRDDDASRGRRIRTFAPHPGHFTRSVGSAGITRSWPQRQVARGIGGLGMGEWERRRIG